MRTLVLMRGASGVGKSTFIKQQGLQHFTICGDDIRLLHQAPILNIGGEQSISQANDRIVWSMLFNILEERMKRGCFTIVDATHTTEKSINAYKQLAEDYRYTVYVVDFSDVPKQDVMIRNYSRKQYKRVPVMVIDRMYDRLKSDKIPRWVKVIKPHQFADTFKLKPLNLNDYKKVNIIGDVHGCYCALMKLLKDGLPKDEMFIFCGDYIDRGIQNTETINFLMSISSEKNVILLEGNHDRYLWQWSHDDSTSTSKEFWNRTRIELEKGEVSKKEVRSFYRKLRQVAYFTYHGKEVVVTHGGLSLLPKNLMLVNTEQMIRGVGGYEEPIDTMFLTNSNGNAYQVHGHRNIQEYPIQVNERCFNLEGKVEFGGELRVVSFSKDGIETIAIENDVWNKDRFRKAMNIKPIEVDNGTFLRKLRECKLIQENRLYNDISSFNFKRNVFYDKLWDEQTIKARGLFINTKTTEIVARSYNKFFNLGEIENTKVENLKDKLTFPTNVFVKENGYLGIVGYNSERDELVIASKSSTRSDHSKWLEDLFYKQIEYSDKTERQIKDYLNENNCTLIFEVMDMDNDPHIIEYGNSWICLLDIVYRTPNYQKMDYDKIVEFGTEFNFRFKRRVRTLNTWEEFLEWHKEVTQEDYLLDGLYNVEGFVLEDSNGFMTKIKVHYYNFWKYMRGVKDRVASGKEVSTQMFNDLAYKFYNWLLAQDKELLQQNIIELRNKYYEEEKEDYGEKSA